jgi:hypothetical protein
MWIIGIGLVILFLLVIDTRGNVKAVEEQISMLQQEFIEEMSTKYGGLYGQK